MRILLLAPHPFFAQRGTPIAVRAALEALAADGHEVDLISFHEGEDVDIPGVRHVRTRRPPLVRHVPIGPSWQKVVCDLFLLFETARALRRERYDVIHAVEEAAFLAWLLRPWARVPYVFDMDSLMSQQIAEKSRVFWPVARLFAWLEPLMVRRAAGVLAVCPALVEEVERHRPSGPVALLPDTPIRGRPEGALPEGLTHAPPLRFVYVGNLEAYQGIDLMLDAFALVACQTTEATLVVVGGTPEEIARYRARVASLAEKGRVRFVGPCPVDQLSRVLAEAHVLVSPRIRGCNTPMKIYSYLQSGKPILATRLRTHTQVLDDRVACLVAPSAEAMAEGMGRLLREPELRARIGESGRALVEAEYSEDAFRSRLRRFYAGLASPPLEAVASEA